MKNLEKLEEDIIKYWNACKTPEEALEIVNYIISHPSAKWGVSSSMALGETPAPAIAKANIIYQY